MAELDDLPDEELLDLFEKDRLGMLEAADAARLKVRLADPKVAAAWDDLRRFGRAMQTRRGNLLSKGFEDRVMAKIDAVEKGLEKLPEIPDEVFARPGVAPVRSDLPPTRPAEKAKPRPRVFPGLRLGAAAAALVIWSVGMMAVGDKAEILARLGIDHGGMTGGREVSCEAKGALLDSGERKDLSAVKADYKPRFQMARPGGEGVFTLQLRYPAGQVCASEGPDLACAHWEEAPVTVEYRCGE